MLLRDALSVLLMLAVLAAILVLFAYAVAVTICAMMDRRPDPAVRRISRAGRREVVPPFLRRYRYPHRCPKGGHDSADAWIDCEADMRKETVKS